MKLTKAKLKRIIKEEIGMLEQAGHERGEFKVSDLMANVDGYPAEMDSENQLGVAIEKAIELAIASDRLDVKHQLYLAHEELMWI